MITLETEMEIKYLGGNCFRLREKEIYLLLGESDSKVEADIVLPGTFPHKKRTEIIPKKRSEPFIIPGPGEYELEGVEIWSTDYCSWLVQINNWRVGFINSDYQVPDGKKVDFFGRIDILFLIISEKNEGAKKAAGILKKISPSIVIPGGEKETIKMFLDEMDKEDLKPQEKLQLTNKDLPEETEVILLRAD